MVNPQQIQEERRNRDFVQLRKSYMQEMPELVKKNPIGVAVLFFLMGKMDRLQNSVVASYTVLQEQLGYSRNAIAKAIRELQRDQWISIERSGNMSIYSVNEQVAWQAANNQRHYARFSATVLLSSTEQDRDVSKPRPKLKRLPAYIQDMPRNPSMDVPEDLAKESA